MFDFVKISQMIPQFETMCKEGMVVFKAMQEEQQRQGKMLDEIHAKLCPPNQIEGE